MNYVEVILRHGAPYTITRRAIGTFVNGRYQQNVAFSEIKIVASIQPIDFKTLMLLAEGQRTRAKFKLFTITELQTIADPDEITFRGVDYQVQGIRDWHTDGNFFAYILMKKEAQPNV